MLHHTCYGELNHSTYSHSNFLQFSIMLNVNVTSMLMRILSVVNVIHCNKTITKTIIRRTQYLQIKTMIETQTYVVLNFIMKITKKSQNPEIYNGIYQMFLTHFIDHLLAQYIGHFVIYYF